MRHCEFCNQDFDITPQQFGGHKRNCKFNPRLKEINIKILESKGCIKEAYKFLCQKCNKEYELSLTLKQYEDNNFKKNCSASCANGRSHSEKSKRKISEKLFGRIKFIIGQKSEVVYTNCEECGKLIASKNGNKFCSKSCLGKVAGRASANLITKRSKNEVYFADLCKSYYKDVLTNEQIFNG